MWAGRNFIIGNKREAHWPLFLYFYCKYLPWFSLISGNAIAHVPTKVNCQALVSDLLLSHTSILITHFL